MVARPARVLIDGTELTAYQEWQSFRVTESIGQPDHFEVTLLTVDATVATIVTAPLGNQPGTAGFHYVHAYLGDDLVFSGVLRTLRKEVFGHDSDPDKSIVRFILAADGWSFLAPLRKVGIPTDSNIHTQTDGTEIPIDPAAHTQPTSDGVVHIWDSYWVAPAIDLVTFVESIGAAGDEVYFDGTDIEGATDELVAQASASAIWFTANDSPDDGDPEAPHLALHLFVPQSDEWDPEYPAELTYPAPYMIDNDNPDWVTSIPMLKGSSLGIDHTQRRGAAFVKGATWDGTGWMGSPGTSEWGDDIFDAPGARTALQRDAVGGAFMARHARPEVTGTMKVGSFFYGWHKGQSLWITDSDLELDHFLGLIRSVQLAVNSPDEAEYSLEVGDIEDVRLGYLLRKRQAEQDRQEVAPTFKFWPWSGWDTSPAAGDSVVVTFQYGTTAGALKAVAGIAATWGLLVDGVALDDPEDSGELYYLSNVVEETDIAGQVTATVNVSAGAAGHSCQPFVDPTPP